MNKQKAIFVANRAFALTSSRLRLIKTFKDMGWQVIVATDSNSEKLDEPGINVEPVLFNRGGFSPFRDVFAFFKLVYIYRTYKPTIIYHFNAKPVILGNLACVLTGNCTKTINTITGLGHAFINKGFTRHLAIWGYRIALKKSNMVIFQNRDDLDLFLGYNLVERNKTKLIVSSGVDIEKFSPVSSNNKKGNRERVLMIGRLLWEKGVGEFVQAAEIVKKNYHNVDFDLGGEVDSQHPDAVEESYICAVHEKGTVNFIGYVSNMKHELRNTDLVVLPSYREGVPRVLLEAAACGIPVIATDVPGCREAAEHNETGLLVPPRDSESLAEAILKLLNDPSLRQYMGEAGRKRAEEMFDIKVITEKQLAAARELGVDI